MALRFDDDDDDGDDDDDDDDDYQGVQTTCKCQDLKVVWNYR